MNIVSSIGDFLFFISSRHSSIKHSIAQLRGDVKLLIMLFKWTFFNFNCCDSFSLKIQQQTKILWEKYVLFKAPFIRITFCIKTKKTKLFRRKKKTHIFLDLYKILMLCKCFKKKTKNLLIYQKRFKWSGVLVLTKIIQVWPINSIQFTDCVITF